MILVVTRIYKKDIIITNMTLITYIVYKYIWMLYEVWNYV